ncbi:MAG: hypothetical protein A2086_04410 [Spirochaetes bacterium GWD1_27_9]|nr:MAG: hypothetical protein A2Y34_00695 [Spirochaetes bacterium GWC1_27_15]OHD32329.1 MAG: hypothetical protein A2086_04410 [Spirochaetes bacterium GWD1_27_9]
MKKIIFLISVLILLFGCSTPNILIQPDEKKTMICPDGKRRSTTDSTNDTVSITTNILTSSNFEEFKESVRNAGNDVKFCNGLTKEKILNCNTLEEMSSLMIDDGYSSLDDNLREEFYKINRQMNIIYENPEATTEINRAIIPPTDGDPGSFKNPIYGGETNDLGLGSYKVDGYVEREDAQGAAATLAHILGYSNKPAIGVEIVERKKVKKVKVIGTKYNDSTKQQDAVIQYYEYDIKCPAFGFPNGYFWFLGLPNGEEQLGEVTFEIPDYHYRTETFKRGAYNIYNCNFQIVSDKIFNTLEKFLISTGGKAWDRTKGAVMSTVCKAENDTGVPNCTVKLFSENNVEITQKDGPYYYLSSKESAIRLEILGFEVGTYPAPAPCAELLSTTEDGGVVFLNVSPGTYIMKVFNKPNGLIIRSVKVKVEAGILTNACPSQNNDNRMDRALKAQNTVINSVPSGTIITELGIKAYIDGKSELYIQNGQIWWKHILYCPPGMWQGRNEMTSIEPEEIIYNTNDYNRLLSFDGSGYNGGYDTNFTGSPCEFGWFPIWYGLESAPARLPSPSPPFKCQLVSLKIIKSRGTVTIPVMPSKANSFLTVVHFDDAGPGQAEADWYDILLSFASTSEEYVENIQLSNTEITGRNIYIATNEIILGDNTNIVNTEVIPKTYADVKAGKRITIKPGTRISASAKLTIGVPNTSW